MKIHEYQAKTILKSYGIPVQEGYIIEDPERIAEIIAKVQEDRNSHAVMVKAQVHAGGRGKGGGVKYCPDYATAVDTAKRILGMRLVTPQTSADGQLVRKVLVTPAADIAKEYYLAMTLDRSRARHVIIASAEGGMDIEEVAHKAPDKIFKEPVDPVFGLQPFQAYKLVSTLGFSGKNIRQAVELLMNLYAAYLGCDASLIELNPLVGTADGDLMALDAKINIDDNALFRHPEIVEMRDIFEEDPTEVEASHHRLNYVKLEGNVGCMVNGAGLAMATMDIIKLKGGKPANFLDVGGGANAETVKNGFRIILSDPHVTAVLINIFGGIVRCDRVANGIIAAVKELDLSVPVVVRLEGTNATEAKQILASSGVAITPAGTLDDAAVNVVAMASKAA